MTKKKETGKPVEKKIDLGQFTDIQKEKPKMGKDGALFLKSDVVQLLDDRGKVHAGFVYEYARSYTTHTTTAKKGDLVFSTVHGTNIAVIGWLPLEVKKAATEKKD